MAYRGILVTVAYCMLAHTVQAQQTGYRVDPDSPEALAPATTTGHTDTGWFARDRFGLMVCWGISVVPKTTWKDLDICDTEGAPGDPSWYFNRMQIPLSKWTRLAGRFNPRQFDADAWVRLAKTAGARYLIFTAKHHDGFAMYDSACSKFDIVDATPFKRDPLKDLAVACRQHGIRLCLYYSQAQDWEHPDGANNTWDFKPAEKNFSRYFEEKCKPQVRELLTQYGPIGLFWFDTPVAITAAQSRELCAFVKSIQPDCLINSRVGNGAGDYMSMGDSQFPDAVLDGLWETACTSSTVWYYMDGDKPRMTPAEAVRYLVGNVSRGGNLALNFGPDYNGVIPAASATLLREIGDWLNHNGEAVYENGRTPFFTPFEWGTVTVRPGFIYLHITRWPGKTLDLYGLESKVSRAILLADGTELKWQQGHDKAADLHALKLYLPETMPDPIDTVVRLKIDGHAKVQQCVLPQNGDVVRLEALLAGGTVGRQGSAAKALTPSFAKVHVAASGPHMRITEWGGGYFESWLNTEEYVSWNTMIRRPGDYDVYAVTAKAFVRQEKRNAWLWDGDHEVTLEIGNSQLNGVIGDQKIDEAPVLLNPRLDKICRLGTIRIDAAGKHVAVLKVRKFAGNHNVGLTLRSIAMIPTEP